MALKIAKTTNTMSGKQLEAIGTRAFELGDLDKALDNLLAALEQDDQNASLFLKVGVIQVQKGNIDKALIAIKRSLELAPYEADAYNAMGVVLSLLEFWGAAEKFFRKALILDPTHASAKSSLVDTMKRMRDGDNEPPAEFGTVLALLETQEPRLSLCMIAKNEEQFLGDCLASVRGLVDEIILVDTGSTDRTVAIAEGFGAKIFHFPWNGDFAAARNESLSHATGDWILVLDADETIPADGHAELRKVLRSKDYAGFSMIIENLLGEEGEKSQTALIFRLFQNRPDIRFEGIIHEQAMLAAQRTGLPINNVRTRIIHRGYLDQHLTQRDKYQRNLDILLRQVEQDPQNPYALFNLGQTYKLMNRFSESEQAYKTSLALLEDQKAPATTSYWPSLFFSLADLYRLMGELEKGLDVAEEALSRYPNFPDILFTKGFILLGLDRFEEAITIFQACRAYKGIVYASGNDPSVSTYKSSQALGAAYARMGQHSVAKRYYLQALQEWDHPNAELYTNLGVVHLQLGELQPALQYFIKAVELNERNSQAWGNIGYICQQFGQHEEALTARAKAYGLDPVENGFAFGTALLHAKNFSEAERVLTEQTELKSDHAPGWIYLGLIKLCLGKLDEAMQTWQHLEKRPRLDEKSREDASALLNFSRMLAGDQIPAGEVGSFSARDGEFWALLVSHLLLAERYSDVESALQFLQSLAVPGLDLAMGRMLGQYGLHEEAMAFLLKAREQSPEDVAVYVLLGEAAEGMKNVEDAQVMYQMALSLDPKQVAIRQRLGRLRLLVAGK